MWTARFAVQVYLDPEMQAKQTPFEFYLRDKLTEARICILQKSVCKR